MYLKHNKVYKRFKGHPQLVAENAKGMNIV